MRGRGGEKRRKRERKREKERNTSPSLNLLPRPSNNPKPRRHAALANDAAAASNFVGEHTLTGARAADGRDDALQGWAQPLAPLEGERQDLPGFLPGPIPATVCKSRATAFLLFSVHRCFSLSCWCVWSVGLEFRGRGRFNISAREVQAEGCKRFQAVEIESRNNRTHK